jgi:3-(methylthio)propionyl---CoA ligase
VTDPGRTTSIYDHGLDKGPANYAPLTPIGFLERAAAIYPEKTAVIHGDTRFSYREFYKRARRLASALVSRGIGYGDTVSVMAFNVPAMLEAHYGVPMTGAVLNTLNIRLDAAAIAFILDHAETKVLITDREFSQTIKAALDLANVKPLVIDIDDQLHEGGELLGQMSYEAFIAGGDPNFAWSPPEDEWHAISLNYTSGTTGNPKGVVYHHRGAYLAAMGNALVFGVSPQSVYLWTVPMFHCNGWTFPWALTAVAGTHVCLRRVDPALIFPAIQEHGVTHMCGAPIVLTMMIHAPEAKNIKLSQTVELATGGSAPPSAVIRAMEEMNFRVTHLYGLTEVYGPATFCAWQDSWDDLAKDEQARLMARQGVIYPMVQGMMVADPKTLTPLPHDGESIGEIFLRGNSVMCGYLKNPDATKTAFDGDWFHSGDLAVQHSDGYIEIKDRSKDIIISGGENISSIEVEEVLYRHPDIMEAAVVAKPSEKWGESPCAFVMLRPGAGELSAEDVIKWCRDSLAHYKCPRHVVFGELPKTSTGKIQKFILRERALDT